MQLKTDLKRIKKLSNVLGTLMDERNKKVCSDCIQAYIYDFNWENKKVISTIKDARDIGKIESKEAGCCSGCHDFYWRNHNDDTDKQLKKLKRKYKWDNYYRFFDTENKCCKLPRYERPLVCLSWGLDCLFERGENNEEKRNKIWKITNIMRKLRIKHDLLI